MTPAGRRWEHRLVHPHVGDDRLGGPLATPGDGVQPIPSGSEQREHPVDLGVESAIEASSCSRCTRPGAPAARDGPRGEAREPPHLRARPPRHRGAHAGHHLVLATSNPAQRATNSSTVDTSLCCWVAPGRADRGNDAATRAHSNSSWCRDGPRISRSNGLSRTKESRTRPGTPDAHPPWRPPTMGVSSGFCPPDCFRRIAPAACANDLPLETAGDRCEPLGSDGVWTKGGLSGAAQWSKAGLSVGRCGVAVLEATGLGPGWVAVSGLGPFLPRESP